MNAAQAGIQAQQFNQNLQFRKSEAGIQAQQFRTNLSEKARQFDISHKLAVTEQNLRERKFTLDLENADLDQQYRQEQITQAQALNEKNRKLLADQEQFAPSVRSYRNDLMQWNGMGEPPPVDPSLPTAIRDMLNVERSDAYEEASTNQNLIEKRNGFSYMVQNHPDKMGEDADGNLIYNRVQYLKLKGQDAKRKAAQDRELQIATLLARGKSGTTKKTSLEILSSIVKDSTDSDDDVNLGKVGVLMREAKFSQQRINEVLYGLDPMGALRILLLERKNMGQDSQAGPEVLADAPTAADIEERKKQIGMTQEQIDRQKIDERVFNAK